MEKLEILAERIDPGENEKKVREEVVKIIDKLSSELDKVRKKANDIWIIIPLGSPDGLGFKKYKIKYKGKVTESNFDGLNGEYYEGKDYIIKDFVNSLDNLNLKETISYLKRWVNWVQENCKMKIKI